MEATPAPASCPPPHPLSTVAGVLLAPLDADAALRVVAFLALGAPAGAGLLLAWRRRSALHEARDYRLVHRVPRPPAGPPVASSAHWRLYGHCRAGAGCTMLADRAWPSVTRAHRRGCPSVPPC